MCAKLFLLLLPLVLTFCKDVSESERASRAAFVQRLLNKQKYLEGRVKLIGGVNKFEGNVYVYHAGRWGAVCDDSWDDAAATVVCSGFNKSGIATYASQYGEATAKYWMDDVVCEGDEISLTHCLFSGWGSSDCEKDEAAGVVCTEHVAQNIERKTNRYLYEVLNVKSTSLRLVGGRNSREGRVEEKRVQEKNETVVGVTGGRIGGRVSETPLCAIVSSGGATSVAAQPVTFYARLRGGRAAKLVVHPNGHQIYHNRVWGSICPDGWSPYEASVVCRHLALGYAEQALQTDLFRSSRISFQGIQCHGNESNLFMCRHKRVGHSGCTREPGHVAAVVCTQHLADLLLDLSAIERTAHLQDVPMYQLQCAMEENCLSKSAYEIQRTNENWQFETRRLLRFTAASMNIGNAEFRPYLPKHLWQWHLCHMHYHSMEVFATFDVLDATGTRVAEGHKASFCLEDNTCLSGVEKKYSCKNYGDQGVSINCSDIYQYNIDCQWVDVTDVLPGDYNFKVAVNPHARVAEQSYDNNAATCVLRLTESYAVVYNCKLERP